MRRSARPPGSTLTISGSASVRPLARKASYWTSLRSGAALPLGSRLHTRHRRHGALLRHAGHRARFLEVFEDLFGRREAEIGQHRNDLLLIGAVGLVVDDERRRHQPLFLQPLMRVHPERAAEVQGEVVVRTAARRYRRTGNPRHAVLPPRRRHPVPMDEARFADAVLDAHAEGLADFGGEPERPVWLSDAVDRRRLAIHLDVAPLKTQDRRPGLAAACRSLGPGKDRRRGQSRNAACEKCATGYHARRLTRRRPRTSAF